MAEIKFFDTWSSEGIVVGDRGLARYITLEPKLAPKTGARYIGNRFHKSKISIVERLINKVMIPGHRAKKHKITSGHITGKANNAAEIVRKCFEIIETKTKENPIAVLVKAIENAAPREEIIAIEYGGARYPKPVEMAPQRRIDYVLRLMTQGAYQKAFNTRKAAEETLANEIMAAFNASNVSAAIAKKLEVERQCDSSR